MADKKAGLSRPQFEADKAKLISRLKEAREYIGVSQEKVAIYLEVNRSAVSEIESGKRSISAVELKKLAALYQRPISWFTDDLVENVPPDIEYLARTATELSDNDRGELQRFADFLKSKAGAGDANSG